MCSEDMYTSYKDGLYIHSTFLLARVPEVTMVGSNCLGTALKLLDFVRELFCCLDFNTQLALVLGCWLMSC